MTLGEKQELFTENIAKLILYAGSSGFKARLREVQRTKEQQEIYVAEGKSWTMNSKHLESLAADIYFTKEGKIIMDKANLEVIGSYWENLCAGNCWGGNYEKSLDTPHFELKI